MRIAVLSDLHLGDKGRTDRFAHDDGDFLRWLRHLESDFERIVLLGDIWEALSPARYGDVEAAFHRARAAHPAVAERFERPKYTYIHGNHDLIARSVLGTPGSLRLHVDGMRLHFTHGHGFDPGWRKKAIGGEYGYWLVGWLMRMGLRSVVRHLDHLPNWLAGVGDDPDRCRFQAAARALADRQDVDVLVTGHTHVGGTFPHGQRLLLNSGSCHWGRRTFLEIDTRAGIYELRGAA